MLESDTASEDWLRLARERVPGQRTRGDSNSLCVKVGAALLEALAAGSSSAGRRLESVGHVGFWEERKSWRRRRRLATRVT